MLALPALAAGAPKKHDRHTHAHHETVVRIVLPRPRPSLVPVAASPMLNVDLSRALPVSALDKLPSTAEQERSLKGQIAQTKPAVASAKRRSDALEAEALALKQKLVATAARIEHLEAEDIALNGKIAQLQAEDRKLSAGFNTSRIAVTRLLAILERLQHDMPPAMAVRPHDALAAARGAMLLGAALPPVYARAAALARRIEALKATRAALVAQRAKARATVLALAQARGDLAALLARKRQEAGQALERYAGLRAELVRIAAQAGDLQALLNKVSRLRDEAPEKTVVTVTAQNVPAPSGPAHGSLRRPVVGLRLPPSENGGLGLTYLTAPGAQVIAPSDGKVLFAGPYHKSGYVLILQIAPGYDLVLTGMGRVVVRPGDELLAGEPVGTMPDTGSGPNGASRAMRLYFELRHDGHELNPAPWLIHEPARAEKI